MTDRTETIVSRSCGVLALALVGLALLPPAPAEGAKGGGSMPKLSARTLWPRQGRQGRTATARPATPTQEKGGIIFAPTPAFRAQQERQQAIKDKWAKKLGAK